MLLYIYFTYYLNKQIKKRDPIFTLDFHTFPICHMAKNPQEPSIPPPLSSLLVLAALIEIRFRVLAISMELRGRAGHIFMLCFFLQQYMTTDYREL